MKVKFVVGPQYGISEWLIDFMEKYDLFRDIWDPTVHPYQPMLFLRDWLEGK